MIGPPKEITGTGEFAHWSRSLLRHLADLRLLDGPGYRKRSVPGGFVLDIYPSPGGTIAAAPAAIIKAYTIAGIGNAGIFDGTQYVQNGQVIVPHFVFVTNPAGGANLPVLLPYKLQAIPSETIDGTRVGYAYTENANGVTAQTRVASTAAGGNETQVIVPRYLGGDQIFCMSITSLLIPNTNPASTAPVALLDVNIDGRAWAASSAIV